jgi:hypothetical protein
MSATKRFNGWVVCAPRNGKVTCFQPTLAGAVIEVDLRKGRAENIAEIARTLISVNEGEFAPVVSHVIETPGD